MHVDAFFEYLLNRPNPYWTTIPTDPNPVNEFGRDGVAAEDDMALRALLPHIRPRRGRRKPEEDETNKSPSQRPAGDEEYSAARPEGIPPWSAHPDGRQPVFLFPVSDSLRSSAGTTQPSVPPWVGLDLGQTPLTAYPHSAVTPSTRHGFWADEPKSAITPSKPRSLNKRHGAKVVSSAWRSGLGGTGKARGRPPLNKGNNEGPFSAFPSTDLPSFKVPTSSERSSGNPDSGSRAPSLPTPSPTSAPPQPAPPASTPCPDGSPSQDGQNPRPAKRSRLSLQVPARVGGEVRLATPPPVVTINGEATPAVGDGTPPGVPPGRKAPTTFTPTVGSSSTPAGPSAAAVPHFPPPSAVAGPGPEVSTSQSEVRFEDPSDKTNRRELEAFFAHEIFSANWFDAKGNRIAPCDEEEAYAIVTAVIDSLRRAAATKDAFLINLAALAGGRVLMSTTNLDITRLEELPDRTTYHCNWELRLGDIRGIYTMHQAVMHNQWKKPDKDARSSTATPAAEADTPPAEEGSAEHWQKKYRELCDVMRAKERQLSDIRLRVLESLRVSRLGD